MLLKELYSRRSCQTLIFWILVTAVFAYDRRYLIIKSTLPDFFICTVVRIAMLIGLGWLHLQWLIPRYLMKRRYVTYGILVLLLTVSYLLLQSCYDYYLYGFVIGAPNKSPFSLSLAYNFTHTSLYLVLTVALKFSMDWYEQNKKLQEMQVQKLQAEVNYLRAQVNPHFLFNALNNLYALTLQRSEQAPDVVLKLSEMMEYMLYESDEPLVSLDKEIRYLHNFFELEKLRQGNQAEIRFTVIGPIDRCRIPPFLLLPIVENAFKHGISSSLRHAYLHMDIVAAESLEVRLSNNKLNIAGRKTTGGIGLANLQKRLELFYPGGFVLEIDDQPEHYRIYLKINHPC